MHHHNIQSVIGQQVEQSETTLQEGDAKTLHNVHQESHL